MFVSTYRYPYIISRHFIVFNLVAKHFLLFAFLWSKLCNATLDNKLLSWQVDLYCNYVSQLVQILMNTSLFNRVQSEGCKLKTRFFFILKYEFYNVLFSNCFRTPNNCLGCDCTNNRNNVHTRPYTLFDISIRVNGTLAKRDYLFLLKPHHRSFPYKGFRLKTNNPETQRKPFAYTNTNIVLPSFRMVGSFCSSVKTSIVC